MIRLGVRGWELHRGPDCGGCEPVPGLRDQPRARLWLQQFRTDAQALYEIRHLLLKTNVSWALPRVTMDQTIDWMANLLREGLWHVHAQVPRDGGSARKDDFHDPAEKDLLSVSATPVSRPFTSPPTKPSVDEGLLQHDADEEAIAAAMKLAAKLGIPFCEECARAALKRAKEAA